MEREASELLKKLQPFKKRREPSGLEKVNKVISPSLPEVELVDIGI